MESISLVIFLKLLGLAAAAGLGSKVTGYLVSKLPKVDAHTKVAWLNTVLDTLGNGAESVVKSVLNSGDVDALLTAAAAGTPIGEAFASLLPLLKTQLISSVGPAVNTALTTLVGNEQAATNIENAIMTALHDVWTAHKATVDAPQPGQVAALASGHLLVVPHGQPLPEGSKLVASLPLKAA